MVSRLTINGTPSDYQVFRNVDKNHAEKQFIKNVIIPAEEEKDTIEIKIFISYSPCNGCADSLIQWLTTLRAKWRKVSITIKFSSFYLKHRDGLKKLIVDGVTLTVFQGQADWNEFFQCIGREITDFQELITQRTDRETIDANMLQGII